MLFLSQAAPDSCSVSSFALLTLHCVALQHSCDPQEADRFEWLCLRLSPGEIPARITGWLDVKAAGHESQVGWLLSLP